MQRKCRPLANKKNHKVCLPDVDSRKAQRNTTQPWVNTRHPRGVSSTIRQTHTGNRTLLGSRVWRAVTLVPMCGENLRGIGVDSLGARCRGRARGLGTINPRNWKLFVQEYHTLYFFANIPLSWNTTSTYLLCRAYKATESLGGFSTLKDVPVFPPSA